MRYGYNTHLTPNTAPVLQTSEISLADTRSFSKVFKKKFLKKHAYTRNLGSARINLPQSYRFQCVTSRFVCSNYNRSLSSRINCTLPRVVILGGLVGSNHNLLSTSLVLSQYKKLLSFQTFLKKVLLFSLTLHSRKTYLGVSDTLKPATRLNTGVWSFVSTRL